MIYGAVFSPTCRLRPVAVTWLSALLFVMLGGTYALFGMPTEPTAEQTFEQAQLRLAVLYVAGLGDGAVALELRADHPVAGRGGGFDVIPAFFATLSVHRSSCIPLLVIGLRGTEPRIPNCCAASCS